jgi:hypothetical protein
VSWVRSHASRLRRARPCCGVPSGRRKSAPSTQAHVMLRTPLFGGRRISVVCCWVLRTKSNCGDPSPRPVGAQGGRPSVPALRVTDGGAGAHDDRPRTRSLPGAAIPAKLVPAKAGSGSLLRKSLESTPRGWGDESLASGLPSCAKLCLQTGKMCVNWCLSKVPRLDL